MMLITGQQMNNLLFKLKSSALDLLFPLQCLGCQREGHLLCNQCRDGLDKLIPPYCTVCAQPSPRSLCTWCRRTPLAIDGIRAPYLMHGPVKEAIHSLKYRSVRAIAPELADLLAQFLARRPITGDLLVPVPLHSRRLRSRGYNQSALLARELGKLTGLAVDERLLFRTRDTPRQVHATGREQRRSNVQDSFRCTADISGFEIIMLDDVATTGSTLSACAGALWDAGAGSVWGLTVAREG